tara:strand:- start:103 stop:321 length:219 start_codon:yes stop_codon:yes gene_type:complete
MKININTDDKGVDLILKALGILIMKGKDASASDEDIQNAHAMKMMITDGLEKGEVIKYEGLSPSKCEEGVCD